MINFYDGHKVYMDGNYPAIFLNGKSAHIHRLEWSKHYGKIPEGCVIHHRDENKMNWTIENLELMDRGNHVLRHVHNLHNESTRRFGETSRNHKLSQSDVDYVRRVFIKYDKEFGGRALAKQFDVTPSCISQIIHTHNWEV